ncbi:MAG: chromosomal replication initiator protein DnaA, partial [Acidimicrobiales bacterium]
MNDTIDLWTHVADVLREQVSEATWKTWLAGLLPLSFDGDLLVVSAPSAFVRDRVESRFLLLLSSAASEAVDHEVKVRLDIASPQTGPDDAVDHDEPLVPMSSASTGAPSGAGPVSNPGPAPTTPTRSGRPGTARHLNPSAAAEEIGIDPRYTFDAFVTGSSNRFAHAAALAVAEMPARSYNPLFIHGEAGLGKTHLLHAIGNYVLQNFSSYRVRYVSTETFMNDFVDAIRNNTTTAFKRRYRQCDVLLIDDVQFMEGKESLQEEFFHTFNHLYGASKQVVLTSDRPPKSIATLEDRLRSRFLSGLITDVQPPELETRLAILRKKSE